MTQPYQQSGYPAAVERYLPQVLSMMISQNVIDNNTANQVSNNINNWMNGFIGNLPQGQQLQETQFKGFLYEFINNIVAQSKPQQQQGMGWQQPVQNRAQFPMQNMGQQQQQHQMPFSSNNQRAPSFGAMQPQQNPGMGMRTEQNIYADPDKVNNEIVYADTAGPDVEAIPVELTEYNPDWVNDSTVAVHTTHEFGDIQIDVSAFPADDVEKQFSLYDITFSSCIGNVGKFNNMLNNIDNGGLYIGNISFVHAKVIKLAHADAIEHFAAIKDLIGSTSNNIDKLRGIIKYLDGQSRGVFNIFERLILDIFNRTLAARTMQTIDNAGLEINITNLDLILEFIPGDSSVKLDALIKVSGYSDAFNHATKSIINWFNNIEIATSSKETIAGTESAVGITGIGEYLKLSADYSSNIEKFRETYAVIKYNDRVVVTNMSFDNSECITGALSEIGYHIYDTATCALDYIIKDTSNTTEPIKLHNAHGVSVIYGWSLDNKLVCAKN